MSRLNHRQVLRLVSVTALGALVALTGCSGTKTDNSAGTGGSSPSPTAASGTHTSPRSVPAGMGSGAKDGVFPRTVAHFEGKTALTTAPKKVVVISTGQADALLTLGIVPVASTRGDGADLIPAYLKTAYPRDAKAIASVADVGTRFEPSLEAIANVKPDLILMNTAGKDAKALYTSLSALAPTVATQGTGLYWKQDFLLLADAVGKTQEAQDFLDRFHADAATLGERLKKPVTVSFLRMNGNRLRVFGVPSFTGGIAEDAGLQRPTSQRFAKTSEDISNEQLDRADADWLFYGVQNAATKSAALLNAPLWPTLRAVADKTAVPVDDDVFYLNTGPTAARDVLAVLQERVGAQ
ncbi:iron-siderophore ABC transporter substrate-binding protein [Streptomyces sp. CBMA29]|uniref:ABC transporter substrate-binding protein n=1 Tax=Streptomyces sp. CBMA29 TaxID=1896314 RepID=UPI001661DF88|nr:iron-siderophore ABC transporter substrate-binding protein [Streptomyces sp. CBMA29]MBD0734544.1 iron-siderophore ABC transporter substrate-binding protein [Streptomyces sp. CBMA29]